MRRKTRRQYGKRTTRRKKGGYKSIRNYKPDRGGIRL